MIDLSEYEFVTLREGPEFVICRGHSSSSALLLTVTPASSHPEPHTTGQLEREFKLAAKLDSAWAVRPIGFERRSGRATLVLEDPGGDSLARLLGRPLTLPTFFHLAIGIATAVRGAHQAGLVHRNIKPENLLVCVNGSVRLTGFGLAMHASLQAVALRPGAIVGTLSHMAPEQTGRTGQTVDSRSDLYSVGVTLYEMLTGTLPFTATDPIRWIHCHTARAPTPPGKLVNGLPAQIETIVLRLLAKSPSERYQTAAGLVADLQECLDAWTAHGQISSFPLGRRDVPSRLLIPEKLYGRGAELRSLGAAFERVATFGTPELIVVTGAPGAGKSSLVAELQRSVARSQGLFAAGKFDQFDRKIPYATLAHGITSLVHQILGDSDADLDRWRHELLEALGPTGSLMSELIPDLALVIGEQPKVPLTKPQDARLRFYQAFKRMIAVFAKPERPLALFLDDLQWLDQATLDLLERLAADPEVANLLLICAFRDVEVSSEHPLALMFDRISRTPVRMQRVALRPLVLNDYVQLLVDMLHANQIEISRLAELLIERTGGNPFFFLQLLTALSDEQLLSFDEPAACWRWDIEKIRQRGLAQNVAELIADKLARLRAPSLSIVKALACLGTQSTAAALAVCSGLDDAEAAIALEETALAGLISIHSDRCQFVHDRVQEAAYALIPANGRAATHLKIGRALASQSKGVRPLEEQIFEIVNQLNRGAALIEAPWEREEVAALNLIAGKRAKSTSAFAAAQEYFSNGRDLLPEFPWRGQYRLAFDLELNLAECEFLSGDHIGADRRLTDLTALAASLVDHAAVASLRMPLYTTLDRTDRAIETGLEFLRRVGTNWSAQPAEELVSQEFATLQRLLAGRSVEQLIDLPMMTDSDCLATMDVLSELEAPASFTDRNLFHLNILRMTNLSLQYGNCDASPCAYGLLNVILGLGMGDYDTALRFGQLGCDLVDKRGLNRFRARVHTFFGTFNLQWTRHFPLARSMLRRAMDEATSSGDLTFANYSRRSLVSNMLASGEPLAEVQQEGERALAFARQVQFGLAADSFVTHLLLVRELRGREANESPFAEAAQDAHWFEDHLDRGGSRLAVARARYWIQKIQSSFFAEEYAVALQAAEKSRTMLPCTAIFIEIVDYHFFAALATAALGAQLESVPDESALAAVKSHHQRLAAWANTCRENFSCRADLVAAEIARLEGRELDAERLYEAAIQAANASSFVQYEGLANELTARFFSGRGFDTIATTYLANARDCYVRWGADGKVRLMEERHPRLRKDQAPASSSENFYSAVEQLDVSAMLKAAQALSIEIEPKALIDALMRLTIEHAGAERGTLVLLRDGVPRIAASAAMSRGRVVVTQEEEFSSAAKYLPESALRYVLRSRKSLVIDDASESKLIAADEYVQRVHPKSLLCLPVLKQAQLIGALYLENNLLLKAFTPERVTILEFLAAQAVISLENAYLYSDLQRSEAFLAEGQKLSDTGSWCRDLRTGKLVWSEQNYRIFDLDPKQGPPPNYEEFVRMIHPDDLAEWRRIAEPAVAEGRSFSHEFRIVSSAGIVKHIHTRGQPIFDEKGSVREFIGTTMNISERKRREDELRESELVLAHVTRLTTMGELAASIAHEINQPLTSIVTSAETCLLLMAKPQPDITTTIATVERIVRDGRYTGDVIKSIRSMLRKSKPEVTPLDVNDVVLEVIDLVRGELRQNSVALETAFTVGLPPVFGDRIQLQQVVVNLVKNAIESMTDVTDWHKVLRIRTSTSGGGVTVEVEDSGMGLDEVSSKRLFEPFFTTKPQGMGMGLSICRSIVESHNGRLLASSLKPSGSLFQFTLPTQSTGGTELDVTRT